MGKKFKKVLLVYKKSAYSIYLLERKIRLVQSKNSNLKKEIRRFKRAHDEHYETLRDTERILRKHKIRYAKRCRGKMINYGRFDLVITVGGDGTFLEVSQRIKDQAIIGVNSAPSFSVGKLCVANSKNFEKIIECVIDQKFNISQWQRLRLNLKGHTRPIDCVNDILVCHSNPVAMSRYYLEIGRTKEEHRNSGLWIATPAGSSGAIKSAGGKLLRVNDKKIQYMPRELYYGFNKNYRLTGSVLKPRQTISITSLMRQGMIFVDGTHFSFKFPFNEKLKVSFSPHPLKVIHVR